MNQLEHVAALTAGRASIQSDWVEALRVASRTHTLAEVARAAGITRARVSQIVGPTGRRPGRPARTAR